MGDELSEPVWTYVRSIDPQTAGSCLLGLALVLFGILAAHWDEAGRRKLFTFRNGGSGAKRKS